MRIVNRSYQSGNVALILIGINVVVFALQQLIPMSNTYLAMNPLAVIGNKWVWQVFTYMFTHGNISHLLFNMLALFMFGTQVERYMGSVEFLCYYLITGFLAGAFSLAVYCLTGSYWVWLLGASGAIFAVQLAYATFFPNAVIAIWGILPMRAPVMVLVFTIIELVSSFFGFQSGVAHLTHLAGFGFGWVYLLIRFRQNPWRALTGR
ncbi:MAG: rhomboid family intramembrane serine protease [Treponema sp.]|jgi:membrane associated rhomboid family serine protease|nr:rhomboid family intramembrane serine protease [Treponema sp.]